MPMKSPLLWANDTKELALRVSFLARGDVFGTHDDPADNSGRLDPRL